MALNALTRDEIYAVIEAREEAYAKDDAFVINAALVDVGEGSCAAKELASGVVAELASRGGRTRRLVRFTQ